MALQHYNIVTWSLAETITLLGTIWGQYSAHCAVYHVCTGQGRAGVGTLSAVFAKTPGLANSR